MDELSFNYGLLRCQFRKTNTVNVFKIFDGREKFREKGMEIANELRPVININ